MAYRLHTIQGCRLGLLNLCTLLDDYARYILAWRLASTMGSREVEEALANYLAKHKIQHVCEAPYHPQTRGQIERYHRSMKSLVKLDNHYVPSDLEQAIANFVAYYKRQRYPEALNNLVPAVCSLGVTRSS